MAPDYLRMNGDGAEPDALRAPRVRCRPSFSAVLAGQKVVIQEVVGLVAVREAVMGQAVVDPEVAVTDQVVVGLDVVCLGVMNLHSVESLDVVGLEALAAWEGAQVFFEGLLCASEPLSESHDPWSVIVVLVGRRNRGRTATLLAQLARPGRWPASSRPVSGTDTMPSYENPTFTAVTMLPSRSNASLSDMAPASGGDGSKGEPVWAGWHRTATYMYCSLSVWTLHARTAARVCVMTAALPQFCLLVLVASVCTPPVCASD